MDTKQITFGQMVDLIWENEDLDIYVKDNPDTKVESYVIGSRPAPTTDNPNHIEMVCNICLGDLKLTEDKVKSIVQTSEDTYRFEYLDKDGRPVRMDIVFGQDLVKKWLTEHFGTH